MLVGVDVVVVVVVVVVVPLVTTVSASVVTVPMAIGPSTGLPACAFKYDMRLMPRSESSSNQMTKTPLKMTFDSSVI